MALRWKTIAIYIVMGGIITTVPTLINAFLGGYNGMLVEAKIGVGADDFTKFGGTCGKSNAAAILKSALFDFCRG